MVARSVGLLLVAALAGAEAAVAGAAKEAKGLPVAPSDIIYATGSLIYDIHSTAYEAAEGLVTKHGIHTKAKEHLSSILGDDWIASACSKIGCNKKDITDKLSQAQAAVQQAKAQAYEHGAKATDHVNGFAEIAVAKFESFVPKYKGSLPKNFLDLALIGLYVAFVAYLVVRIALFSLSIFCCVCCCGCCRRSGQADTAKKGKDSGKKGSAVDAKAKPKSGSKK